MLDIFSAKGCIFGLDGVLVDTVKYHFQAWRRVSNELGFDFPEEKLEELRSLTRMECLEKILDWGGLYIAEAEKLFWTDVKNNWYIELINEMPPEEVLPGALDLLTELRTIGVKTAVASASKNARTVMRSVGLHKHFDAIVDGESTKRDKPDPECFLLAAQALQLPSHECIVFDDAPLGIMAAKWGGFKVVGVGHLVANEPADMLLPDLKMALMVC